MSSSGLERIEGLAKEICEKYEADEDEVKKKLRLLIMEYRVPEKEAVRSIINQILKDKKTEVKPVDIKVSDLEKMHEGELVNLTVKVLTVYEGSGKKPFAAFAGDDSGVCRMTWWSNKKGKNKFDLEKGKCYRIEGAKVVEFREKKEIQLLDTTTVEEVEADIKVPENKVEFTGVVVAMSKNSGLVPTCPECGKFAPKKTCPDHGKVKPKLAYKVRLVLDNGEECVNALFSDEMVEKLTGMSRKEAMQIAKEELSLDVVRERLDEMLFGKYLTVKGRKIRDIILVDEFEFLKPNEEYMIEEEVIDLSQIMGEEDEETVDEEVMDEEELEDSDDLLSILEDEEGEEEEVIA